MRKRLFIGAFILSGALILTGCGSGQSSISVKTEAAGIKTIQSTVEISGALTPVEAVNISSKISGKVSSADFEVGDTVSEGQLLVQLDTAEASAQLDAARASYSSISDQMKQAKIPLDSAAQDLDRTKILFAEGAVSQQQLDQTQAAYDSARARYDAAGNSGLAQASASVESAEAQMANTKITSSISGVVVTKNIHVGELASPGVNLVSVADISALKLKGTVSQEVFPSLAAGQPIEVSLDAFPGNLYGGTISLLGPVSVGSGSYFPIELTIANPGEVTAGLSAHCVIPLQSITGIAVPKAAVVKVGGDTYVFTVKDGSAHRTIVKAGLSDASYVSITEGLSDGDIVAVTNASVLSDNMPVTVDER